MRSAAKIVLIAAAAAVALTPLPRAAVERIYSRGLYPRLQPALTGLSNSTTFAWFDAFAVVLLLYLAGIGIAAVRARRQGWFRAVVRAVASTAVLAAVCYLWFLGSWGLNYQRQRLTARLDYDEARISSSALRDLAMRQITLLNALHAPAHAQAWPDWPQLEGHLSSAYARVQEDLSAGWRAVPGRPKRSLFNFYFTRVSIDGMTDPFFLEILANQDLLPFEKPATVAHEWGHLAGYAHESEANFVGWLVCMRGDAAAQYSGWLSLYGTVMSALPGREAEDLARQLNPGPRADLRAIAERIARQRVPLASRAGYAVYDRYLKANRVESGIQSYNEVLRLMLGTRFDRNGMPVLR